MPHSHRALGYLLSLTSLLVDLAHRINLAYPAPLKHDHPHPCV